MSTENQPMTLSELDEAIAAADRRISELENQRQTHEAEQSRRAGRAFANIEQYSEGQRKNDREALAGIDNALQEAKQHKADLENARPEVALHGHRQWVEQQAAKRDARRETINDIGPRLQAALTTLEREAEQFVNAAVEERDVEAQVLRRNGNRSAEQRVELPKPGVAIAQDVPTKSELSQRLHKLAEKFARYR